MSEVRYRHEAPDYGVSYISICGISLPEYRVEGFRLIERNKGVTEHSLE